MPLLLVAADSHARVPTELAHALNYPCFISFPSIQWGSGSSWHSSCCHFGPVSWEGLRNREVDKEAIVATSLLLSLKCTKTVVKMFCGICLFVCFFSSCPSLVIIGRFSCILCVYVCVCVFRINPVSHSVLLTLFCYFGNFSCPQNTI